MNTGKTYLVGELYYNHKTDEIKNIFYFDDNPFTKFDLKLVRDRPIYTKLYKYYYYFGDDKIPDIHFQVTAIEMPYKDKTTTIKSKPTYLLVRLDPQTVEYIRQEDNINGMLNLFEKYQVPIINKTNALIVCNRRDWIIGLHVPAKDTLFRHIIDIM